MSTAVNLKKDDSTWLNVCYMAFAVLMGVILWNTVDMIGIQTGWQERYDDIFPMAQNLIAVALAALSVIVLKSDPERHDYYLTSIGEVRKVTWPSMPDTRRMTIVVCIVVGIFALILALFDMVWGKLLGMLLAS